MLSFRKCAGLIIKEMAAHFSNKTFDDVSQEDYGRFLDNCQRPKLSFNIFRILFQVDAVDVTRLETVNTWIKKKNPLYAVIFTGDFGQSRDRPATYTYPNYGIKYKIII
ncbi:unnamed protein product [Macrosiphum euphorbiae]|uniref:Uncharacterized protein n=1 Tax=Macrosiphum euphorbiae TaxID=13131 RepID=A0AAV0XVY9_9HEMI|nr:unnamed protein product [Macrosiphum euphorbiae]